MIRQDRAAVQDPWAGRVITAPKPEVVCVAREYTGPVGRDGTPWTVRFGERLPADDRLLQDAPAGVFLPVEEAVARFEGVVA